MLAQAATKMQLQAEAVTTLLEVLVSITVSDFSPVQNIDDNT